MKRVAWVLISVGLMGLAIGGWLYSRHPEQPTRPIAVDVAQAPSATKPSPKAVDSYNVADDVPKYIEIPAINVPKTRIIQLGLLRNNQIATPHNIYDAGWYNQSAKPGHPGAMFVYGHVSSWQANGVFHDLKKLKAGDKIVITRGDDRQLTYKVVMTKAYAHDNVNMEQVLSPTDPHAAGLNLMTCAGQIIQNTSEFSERLVVFTTLVKN
jgi:LPXTG-site transpeptidase (sortase) family protein